MNFRGFLKHLFIFKFWNRIKTGKGYDGRYVTRPKNTQYYRHNHFSNNIAERALVTPFIVRKYLINNFKRNKAYIFFFDGSVSVIPLSETYCVGGIHYNDLTKRYGFLNDYKFGSRLSWIIWERRRLASARGSSCILFFELLISYILILPSGQLVLSPKDLLCIKDPQIYLKKFIFKKGLKYMKIRGQRPKVRGIAKNPNDHPHGGRTKTILRPRTPWAKPVLRKNNKLYKLQYFLEDKED
jgi:Ribosomal Proteins L2, C-terminal domain